MMHNTLPTYHELLLRDHGGEKEYNTNEGFKGTNVLRVSIYRSHPLE